METEPMRIILLAICLVCTTLQAQENTDPLERYAEVLSVQGDRFRDLIADADCDGIWLVSSVLETKWQRLMAESILRIHVLGSAGMGDGYKVLQSEIEWTRRRIDQLEIEMARRDCFEWMDSK